MKEPIGKLGSFMTPQGLWGEHSFKRGRGLPNTREIGVFYLFFFLILFLGHV